MQDAPIIVKLRRILKAAGIYSFCHGVIFMGCHCLFFLIRFVVWLHGVASLDLLLLPTSAGMKPVFLVDCTFSHACITEHWNWKATRRKIFARTSAYRLPLFVIKFLCSHEKSRMLLWIITESSFTTVRYKYVPITQLYYLRPSICWHALQIFIWINNLMRFSCHWKMPVIKH